MLPAFYTFQDLIKFNSGNWDQVYEVLNYFLDQGKLIKKIRGPEDIIYHNQGIFLHLNWPMMQKPVKLTPTSRSKLTPLLPKSIGRK